MRRRIFLRQRLLCVNARSLKRPSVAKQFARPQAGRRLIPRSMPFILQITDLRRAAVHGSVAKTSDENHSSAQSEIHAFYSCTITEPEVALAKRLRALHLTF